MLFNSLFKYTAVIASITIIGANAAQIKWCNEDPGDHPNTNCVTQDIRFGQCTMIPDSMAKGDKGSFVEILPKAGDPYFRCAMYKSTCTYDAQYKNNNGGGKCIPPSNTFKLNSKDRAVTYQCFKLAEKDDDPFECRAPGT